MDLKQLRAFVEVARHQSFTRAAEALHIAQPAVSMAVAKLEHELELTLLSRDRQVRLTAEGEVLLEHARRILADLRSAQVEMEELRGLLRGEVRIGITPMMSAYYFPRLIRQFSLRYPGLSLSVDGDGAARILQRIERGEIDLGVIVGTKVPEGLECRPFLREEVVACVRSDHPFAKRSSIGVEEFLKEPLLLYRKGYHMRELMDELIVRSAATPDIVFETNLFSLVRSLIGEGLGVSTFLRMVVQGDPGLAAVSFDPPQYLDLSLAWKSGGYMSRANRVFVDFLLKEAAPGLKLSREAVE